VTTNEMTKEEADYNAYVMSRFRRPEASANSGLESPFRHTVKVGTEAPDFNGRLLDGGEIALSRLRGQALVYLVFGPMTCPPCMVNIRGARPSLVELYTEYQPKGFEFFWVYTRETHVGESITRHASFEQKLAHARLFKDEYEVTFPIIVDSLSGEIHKKYGNPVNMSYLIDRDGMVVYKSDWTDTAELPGAFDNLLSWEASKKSGVVSKVVYVEKLHYMLRSNEIDLEATRRVLQRAGPQSAEDIRK